MSKDIFANPASSQPDRVHYGFAGGPVDRAGSVHLIPRDPETQEFVDRINAERDAEIARKAVEMDTPENRQKAIEAEYAERERRRIDFHFCRALPSFVDEGWKHINGELADDEVRVYTTDYRTRRFWGIKPTGMGMNDFWIENDPEVGRYDDNIAITWGNPLIPPPVTALDEINPDIWAGPGLNPDLTPQEPPLTKAPPAKKAAAKRGVRQKTPDINPTHRVKKAVTKSAKSNRTSRKSLAEEDDARDTRREDNTQEVTASASTSGKESRRKTRDPVSSTQDPKAIADEDPATSKRPRGRPAVNAKPPARNDITPQPKRPRGRPAVNPNPPAKDDITPQPKRPRGRPPAKGKPSKQNKSPAVKGNARVSKPAQKERRPLASSIHKMRTRRKGPAESLQLS